MSNDNPSRGAPGPTYDSHTYSHDENCLTLRLSTFLLGGMNLDDLCQFCVLDLLVPLQPWQMSIYSMGTDTLFRLRGSFGQSPGRGNLHEFSCLADIQAGEQLQQGMPLANFPVHRLDTSPVPTFSDLDDGPQVLWPLIRMGRLAGILQVRFNAAPDASAVHQALSAIAAPVTLALDITHPRNRRATDRQPPEAPPPGVSAPAQKSAVVNQVNVKSDETLRLVAASSGLHSAANSNGTHPNSNGRPANDGLSARQQRVLELMAEGMTNGQIARALAFSESTVRQETMAIYRMLKVPNRTKAVTAGRALGLLPARQQS